ncbi:hypothetical protein MMA231_00964 [Asticcacaulis sp. MM231]|uniref:hypothetical protein n=1 Tax=Asticcacaulis sp. MM231 TaxID=3157666 RepID=UPI0032D5A115
MVKLSDLTTKTGMQLGLLNVLEDDDYIVVVREGSPIGRYPASAFLTEANADITAIVEAAAVSSTEAAAEAAASAAIISIYSLGNLGPAVGILPGDPMPPSNVVVDINGHLLSSYDAQHNQRVMTPLGTLAFSDQRAEDAALGVPGPAVGPVASASGLPMASAVFDRSGRFVEGMSAVMATERDVLQVTPAGIVSRTESWDNLPMRQPGPVLSLPRVRILNLNGTTLLSSGSVVSPVTGAAAIASEAFNLGYNTYRFLAYATINGPMNVYRSSDNALLVEGTHYQVERTTGKVKGLINTGDYACHIQYNAYKVRVDFVVCDQAGQISLIQGTEAPRIAKEPAVASPLRKLFRIYRTRTYADIQAVHAYQGAARAAEPQAYYGQIERSRRCLSRLKRTKLKFGDTVRWGAYGDSITAMGGGYAIFTGGTVDNINLNPNVHRDTDGYFADYDTTARSDIPVFYYDDLHPEDVAALTAAGYLTLTGGHYQDVYGHTHVKQGQHWGLVEWIKENYGVTVHYRNWGIGGTNSQNSIEGGGAMNMRYPDRLNAILADNLDVVNIATGMNELGQLYTYDNLMAIGTAFKSSAAKTVPIFCTPVRPDPVYQDLHAEWAFTCGEIERAAVDLDCACVQTAHMWSDNKLSQWLAKDELSQATEQNHPGVRELTMAARLAIDLFN